MAIEKNSFKVSRIDTEVSSRSKESMSSDNDELQRRSSAVDSDEDDDDEFDDCDSGAGSDDYDLLELGEVGEEFCQVEDQTLSIPFELYDLQGLGDVLSMDVWNDCLTEEERFSLTKYLPDMDQETYMRTLKELFIGANLHFGSPIAKLFDMMKGGLTEPRVALYRQGLNSFQKRQHYHLLRKHQNRMVASIYQIKDAWLNYQGYSIEERLRVLNIQKSQKSMMYENLEELESESSERDESGEVLWGKRMKDRKRDLKLGRHSTYGSNPSMDLPSRGRAVSLQQEKLGNQNVKGTLKLGGSKMSSEKEYINNPSTSLHHGQELGHYGSPLTALPRQHMAAVNDLGASAWMRDHMKGVMGKESMYELAMQRDQKPSRINAPLKAGGSKMGKKHEVSGNEYNSGGYTCLPNSMMNDIHTYGGNKTVNKLSDIKVLTTKPSNTRSSYDYSGRFKYPEAAQLYPVEEPMKHGRNRVNNLAGKGSWTEFSEGTESLRYGKTRGDAFSVDPSLNYINRSDKNKKWIAERESSDPKADRLSQFQSRANLLDEKLRSVATQNGGQGMLTLRGTRYVEGEETESDSSEEIDEENEDDNPFMRSKQAYPREVLDASFTKSGLDPKRPILSKNSKKHNFQHVDGSADPLNMMADIGQHHMPEIENLSLKGKRKAKTPDADYLHNSAAKVMESMLLSGSGRLDGVGDQSPVYKLVKNGRLPGEYSESFHLPPFRPLLPDRGQKGVFGHGDYTHQANYMQGYVVDDDDSLGARRLGGEKEVIGRAGKKSKNMVATADDYFQTSDAPSSVSKKRKVKEEVTYEERDGSDFLPSKDSQYQLGDVSFAKIRGKRKLDDDADNVDVRPSEPSVLETGIEEPEPEPELQRKPFILITPTVHTGFSFSVVHLLSAVRMAMTTLLPEDSLEIEKRLAKSDGGEKPIEDEVMKQEGTNGVHSEENADSNKSEQPLPTNVPSLTVQDIVNRVRSNPGDPSILETQEPLLDLVRGVLRILSSKTAPLGAKGWKPLVMFQKSSKTWSWIGPVSHSSSDQEAIEEVRSPEAWGLPHKVLVKLVDAFANWLKNGQETLQQIGSLPAPPLSLTQFNLDEKERFRDLRAQKSLSTIGPSSDEVRDYFRKEELLRYSFPDRAFSYTALDGRKSIVAPLRRCGGKPTSKARDHFMLKRDRPPHVTILCLVRDAAARLPGSIGTRADVCTLFRDSQFIVEDVSDAQVNQIVSGAMDRLHYERDPCVQFDGERKLWVYLHREREEEDFEDDGTSSTKKWKRQKKDNSEPSEQEAVTEADNEAGGNGYDLSSDLNVEASCMDEDKRVDLLYYDDAHNMDNAETSHGSEQGGPDRGHPMAWESLGLNSMPDNRLLCQENSTAEEFDGGTFDREPRAELLSTILS